MQKIFNWNDESSRPINRTMKKQFRNSGLEIVTGLSSSEIMCQSYVNEENCYVEEIVNSNDESSLAN